MPTRSSFAFLLAASLIACSSTDANTDATNADGAGGEGGAGGNDAGAEVDAGEDAEIPEAGPDGAGGKGGSGGGSSETCGTGAPICSEVEDGFDEDESGFLASFDLGVSLMMGQRFGFVAAFFEETAREDYCKEEASTIPLDTCVVVNPEDAPAPQCSEDSDCSPEQKCLPRTNNNSPIPCTEHCQTERTPMDIGPLTVEGFVNGPIELVADPQQSHGYVVPGGGTIPASDFAFDTTYRLSGEGDPDKGIGVFEGQVDLGPELLITSPPLEQGSGFPPVPSIAVNPDEDLVLAWSGSVAGGEVSLELTAADMGATRGHIKCRVSDTGSFTIPADRVKALDLGDTPFLNNLNIERTVKGAVTGEGITVGKVTARQVLLVNMEKKGG